MKRFLNMLTASASSLAFSFLLLTSSATASPPPVTVPEGSSVIWTNASLHQTSDINALASIRNLIELSRREGDLRALGQAESLLNHQPLDLEAQVLRAIIAQRKHHFGEAANTLKTVLQSQPNHPQANFSLLNVAIVIGDYPLAHTACKQLGKLGYTLIFQSCFHNLLGLQGEPQAAFSGLQQALQQTQNQRPFETAWARATLAELAADIKHPNTARYYQQALLLAPNDHYSAASLADWHLQHNQPALALQVLNGRPATDRLDVLRLIALQSQGDTRQAGALQKSLQERFSATAMRDTDIHLHEHARFLLDVMRQPAAAHALAERNYRIQKERSDRHLLQRTRKAVGETL